MSSPSYCLVTALARYDEAEAVADIVTLKLLELNLSRNQIGERHLEVTKKLENSIHNCHSI